MLPHSPDNTFEIKINDETIKQGSLLEDFEPAVNPSKEIDDPEDFKPANWVDDAEIEDVEAVKPDDWDETAPALIIDQEVRTALRSLNSSFADPKHLVFFFCVRPPCLTDGWSTSRT